MHEVRDLKSEGRVVEFGWIPSHVGIEGNEKPDEAAVAAALRPEQYITVTTKTGFQ